MRLADYLCDTCTQVLELPLIISGDHTIEGGCETAGCEGALRRIYTAPAIAMDGAVRRVVR